MSIVFLVFLDEGCTESSSKIKDDTKRKISALVSYYGTMYMLSSCGVCESMDN